MGGSDVWGMMQEDFEERTDPMAMVFPKMAKCTFHKYGPTGTIQRHDGLCILPVNIINEKIYFFLWFWFVALAIITGAQQVYRLLTVLVPGLQVTRMKSLARAVPEQDQGPVKANKHRGLVSPLPDGEEHGLAYVQGFP